MVPPRNPSLAYLYCSFHSDFDSSNVVALLTKWRSSSAELSVALATLNQRTTLGTSDLHQIC